MKPLTLREAAAMESLRAKGSLTVGLRQTRSAMARHGLRQGDVLPGVARGLESRGLVTLHRPDKRGPASMILATGAPMDEQWKRDALIFDVLINGKNVGQVAATNEIAALKEAAEFWAYKRGGLEVTAPRPLYGSRA